MKFAAVLFLAVAVNAAKIRPSSRIQLGDNLPIVLNNTVALAGALSQVTAVCSSADVTLRLTDTGTPVPQGANARIRIGAGDGACDSGRMAIPSEGLVFATAGRLCGRSGQDVGAITSYTWSVQVTEWYPRGEGLEFGPFTADFTVVCQSSASQPDEVPGPSQPGPLDEGLAGFTGQVPFSLTAGATATSRQWILDLQPERVSDLRGLSYRISSLIASTTSAEGDVLSARLIANGCVLDPLGVQVQEGTQDDQKTTITVTAFQFSASPGTAIEFAATVTLCTPLVTGGVCTPVQPEGCSAEGPGPQPSSAGPNPEPTQTSSEEPSPVETSEEPNPVEPSDEPTDQPATPSDEPVVELTTGPNPDETRNANRVRRSANVHFSKRLGSLTARITK